MILSEARIACAIAGNTGSISKTSTSTPAAWMPAVHSGTPEIALQVAGDHQLHDAGRADRLHVGVVAAEAGAPHRAEQVVEGRVLEREHADLLALEVLEAS